MHTFVLQDWLTIRGNGAGSGPLIPGVIITQSEPDWLDLSPFQDVFAWVDVREVTGAVSLYFETSPTEDDNFFQSMTGVGTPAIVALAAGTNPAVVKLPMLSAAVPVARFLRWKLYGSTGTTWDATFRIVVAANSPGM